jgi:hypothetical protein
MPRAYRILCFILFLISSFRVEESYAQKQQKPKSSYAQERTIRDWHQFIPKGYSLLDQLSGDLNLDSIKDLVLVLRQDGEDSLSSIETPIKRKVFILLMQADSTWKLAAQNENVVYHYRYDANFPEAFVDIMLDEAGQFSIDHYGGFAQRWGRTCRFKYNKAKQKWYLFKDEYVTFSATNPEENTTEKEYSPKSFGKIAFEDFDVYKKFP